MTPKETVRLLIDEDCSDKRSKIAILQTAIAAEYAGKELQIAKEDKKLKKDGYPRPALILGNGTVLFEPASAVVSLLGEPADNVGKVNGITDTVLSGSHNGVFNTLSEKIAAFSALYITKPGLESDHSISQFINEESVKRALETVGEFIAPLHQCVRKGIAWSYDWSIKRVPEEGKRNILITSALPYVNNVPHLGNIIGAVLSGDVFARYCRSRGYNVVYVCGTDEYGTATETKALEEGVSCQEICSKYFRIHAAVYDWFQIRFDHFGRTSTPQQTEITHSIFRDLYDRGYFFEESMEQCFCEQCSRFLADRYIEGTCPHCGFHDARGDQCDGCGKLVNPVELIEARCKLCRSRPVVRSSKHLFLDLTKLQPECEAFVNASSARWSTNSAAIAKAWLTEGLKPRCMTRDLRWGTPVPLPGFEDKVFYVWFDAPIGYLSITATYTDQWEQWWKNPQDVQLYQFMGKDNVPFHTVIFPSTLIGTGQPYTLLHHLSTTEYLNYETGKFSKSRGTGVFGNDARDSGIPAAVWRYYLLSTRPETNDAVFTWDELVSKTNGELLANFGNFVNRVTKFLFGKLSGTLARVELTSEDAVFIENVNKAVKEYIDLMEAVKLRPALKVVMSISALGNAYLQESRLDNKLLANEPARCRSVVSLAVNLVYLLAPLVEPFLPSTADTIYGILNAPARAIPEVFTVDLMEGHVIGQPVHLFERLEPGLIEHLRQKHSGKA